MCMNVLVAYMCTKYMSVQRPDEAVLEPLELRCGCSVQNSGPLQGSKCSFTAQLSGKHESMK